MSVLPMVLPMNFGQERTLKSIIVWKRLHQTYTGGTKPLRDKYALLSSRVTSYKIAKPVITCCHAIHTNLREFLRTL